MDKLIEKLSGILAKLGLDEEAINGVIAELTATSNEELANEENPQPEGDPIPPAVEEQQVPPQDILPVPPVDETLGDLPPSDEPPVVDPTQVAEEQNVAPTEQVPPPPVIPPELLEQVAVIQSENEELKKANAGLEERLKSLEEALRSAGIIDGNNPVSQVGDPSPSAGSSDPTEDVLGSVLTQLNSKRTY